MCRETGGQVASRGADDGQTPSELLKVADARLAIDKEHQDPLLDPRRQGVAAVPPPAATRAPSAPQPTRAPVGLIGQVSRREFAREPYLWLATGLVFSLFAAVAAGCALFLPDAPSWSYAVSVAAAVVGAVILFTREGPALDSWANHALLVCMYVGSAVFIAAFPDAAGAGLGIAIFIGTLTAVRLIDRRKSLAIWPPPPWCSLP